MFFAGRCPRTSSLARVGDEIGKSYDFSGWVRMITNAIWKAIEYFPGGGPATSRGAAESGISCDNRHQEAQVTDSEGITVPIFAVSTASYAGPTLVLRILCGSI